VSPRRSLSSRYLACLQCRRVFALTELERERKEKRRDVIVCPYCGSTSFTKIFSDIVLIVNPEKSKVAKYLKIIHPGVFAYTLE